MTTKDQTFVCRFNLTKLVKKVGYSTPDLSTYERLTDEMGTMIRAHLEEFCRLAGERMGLEIETED
tara:strand:- start:9632 stop:9829 length:198 start_codon:yes stop_codon:yes gene_type:complete